MVLYGIAYYTGIVWYSMVLSYITTILSNLCDNGALHSPVKMLPTELKRHILVWRDPYRAKLLQNRSNLKILKLYMGSRFWRGMYNIHCIYLFMNLLCKFHLVANIFHLATMSLRAMRTPWLRPDCWASLLWVRMIPRHLYISLHLYIIEGSSDTFLKQNCFQNTGLCCYSIL